VRAGAPVTVKQSLVKSHDGNEGVEAFLAKRPPIWSNS
jgi:hypothetical protein